MVLPLCTMVITRCTTVKICTPQSHHGITCCTMVYHDNTMIVPWYTMVLPLCTMVYIWCTMVKIMYHGITPWYNMLYHGNTTTVPWYTMVLPWYFSSRAYLWSFRRSSQSNRQKLPSSTTSLSFDAPANRNPCEYPHTLLYPETRVIGLHYCRGIYGSIFIQICAVGSKRRIFCALHCVLAVPGRSWSSKVDDSGTNRKRVYDFLLVGHCDYGPIWHRFWDTVTYWLKIAYFCYIFATPLSFGALAPYVPFAISR